jgi:hypothetical protein
MITVKNILLTLTLRKGLEYIRGGKRMEYTVQNLAQMAGISTRTLRYYDEIEILKPARINSSGYRIYGQAEVSRLQQILFYRELGQKTADLHRQWLSYAWGNYNKEAHAGLAQMYVDDERFTAFYDDKQPGAAVFLRDAILIYTGVNKKS